MGIAVKFVSGGLEGKEFECADDVVRVGDAPDVDVRIDPNAQGNGGARDRVIEVFRDGDSFRIHSVGNRDISAQGETAVDRKVGPGEHVRFGAWGPIFVVRGIGKPSGRVPEKTAPLSVPPMPSPAQADRPKKDLSAGGEKPVGPKTVHMMIQDALGRANRSEGGSVTKGTVFIREMVGETIRHSTRSLKIGLGLMAAAFLVLVGILVFNIVTTRKTILQAANASNRRVENVRGELTTELDIMKTQRDRLAMEAASLSKRIEEVEKTAVGGEKGVGELKSKLKDADTRRQELDARMEKAMAALKADRDSMKAELERLRKDQAAAKEREQMREEEERKAREAVQNPDAPPTTTGEGATIVDPGTPATPSPAPK